MKEPKGLLGLLFWISDVVASNRISSVKTSLNISVLLPLPENLTLTLVTERDWLPWCHPGSSSDYHVFTGAPVELEALLPVSASVMFEWRVVEETSGRTESEVTAAGVRCYHGQSCSSSTQVGLVGVYGPEHSTHRNRKIR